MSSRDTVFEARIVGEEEFFFELAKSAALEQLRLATVPPDFCQRFAEFHHVRRQIETCMLANWRLDKKCRTCRHAMTATKLEWISGSPFSYTLNWFTSATPEKINASEGYTLQNMQLVCSACHSMTADLSVGVRRAVLGRLAQTPMPEVFDNFLVTYSNGLTSYDQAWRKAAEQAARTLHRSLRDSETSARHALAAWEHRPVDDRPRQRPRMVVNDLTQEDIAQQLLRVMTSPWSFKDVTGVECALGSACVNRIDPNGHYSLDNCRIVYSGVDVLRGDAPDDRFLVEALKRWKGLPFSGLLAQNLRELNADLQEP